MSLTLVSCSDDDKGPGSTEELVGMWEVVEGTEWEKEDGEIVFCSRLSLYLHTVYSSRDYEGADN